MTAVVLPIWTPAAAWLAICWMLIGADALSKRWRARRSEARRLRALDELWSDEVGVAPSAARLAGRDSLRTGATPTYAHLNRLIDQVRP